MFEAGFRAFANPLLGGALIGGAASLLLLFNGRVAGVSGICSGIFNGIVDRVSEEGWRRAFLAGLVVGGASVFYFGGPIGRADFSDGTGIGWIETVVAGLLVGLGTVLGSGCTSGHGVCGISRFSLRSIVATLLFIFSGFLTVTLMMKVLR